MAGERDIFCGYDQERWAADRRKEIDRFGQFPGDPSGNPLEDPIVIEAFNKTLAELEDKNKKGLAAPLSTHVELSKQQ